MIRKNIPKIKKDTIRVSDLNPGPCIQYSNVLPLDQGGFLKYGSYKSSAAVAAAAAKEERSQTH